MAVTLNANSSTGFIATSDTSSILQLQTGGTTAVTVDASQNVGIGTASPTDRLDIRFASGTGNLKAGVTAGNNIKIYNSAGDLSITTSDSASDAILDSQRSVIFKTANTERMRVNAGAPILCLSGGNTSATGTGIAFPATQSASTDANTLDDYEEGTWSPQIYYQNATNQAAATNTTQVGFYTKVGNQVTATFYLQFTAPSGLVADNIGVKNFPFSAKNSTNYQASGAADIISSALTANGYIFQITQSANSANLLTALDGANLGSTVGTGTRSFKGTLVYQTD